jgi:hypothetical protein
MGERSSGLGDNPDNIEKDSPERKKNLRKQKNGKFNNVRSADEN